MSNIPLNYLPGVCKNDSAYLNTIKAGAASGAQAAGRFTDMDGMRFSGGKPEQITTRLIGTNTNFTDIPVEAKEIVGSDGNNYLCVATQTSLIAVTSNFTISNNITPLRGILTGTLTNPFDTTNGSAVVTVHHTAHGLITGDYVTLTGGATVGGLTIAGVYTNIQKIDANTYTITASSNATGTVTGGGGTTSYTYYRVTLSNPFDTTSGSPTVTVHHTAHGAAVGDHVFIASASSVGGITPSGLVTVVTSSTNSWTFTWTSNASSTVTGGGGSPNFLYDITLLSLNGSPYGGYGSFFTGALWSLDNYGNQLLASPLGGTIYVWDATIGGRAYPLNNAPTGIAAMFVTPERYVFALGKTGNQMTIQWPDQSDYTNWTPSATNTANSRTLQHGSTLIGGMVVRDGVSMVFSDVAAFVFTYTGDNNVYSSSVAGIGCGLIGLRACTAMGGIGYWASSGDLWMWNGSAQPVPSDDIRDYVFAKNNIYVPFLASLRTHIKKKEVWLFYGISSDTVGQASVNGHHLIYHTDQSCFSTGTLQTAVWYESFIWNTFKGPVRFRADTPTKLYAMDADFGFGGRPDTSAVNITFSPMDISHGDRDSDILAFIPDFEFQQNALALYVTYQQYPSSTIGTSGPYVVGGLFSFPSRVDLRIGAKLIGYQIAGTSTGTNSSNTFWRLGLPRVEAQPAGARR